MKIFATVAVALLAFGAMANPARAQETSLCTTFYAVNTENDTAQVGAITLQGVVYNCGYITAEEVTFSGDLLYGDVQVAPGSFSVSTTQGTCEAVFTASVACALGDIASHKAAEIDVRFVALTPGTISSTVLAQADNAEPSSDIPLTLKVVDLASAPPGGELQLPESKQECKKGGYRDFEVASFKNQGQCVKAANLLGHRR